MHSGDNSSRAGSPLPSPVKEGDSNHTAAAPTKGNDGEKLIQAETTAAGRVGQCLTSRHTVKNRKDLVAKCLWKHCLHFGPQVKLAVFCAYMRAMGLCVSSTVIMLYILNNSAAVYANFWLSDWSNDATVNLTVATKQRDMRLGVYGALGIVQGE